MGFTEQGYLCLHKVFYQNVQSAKYWLNSLFRKKQFYHDTIIKDTFLQDVNFTSCKVLDKSKNSSNFGKNQFVH